MKASYAWISSLVPQLKASPEALAARLTCSGLEVEEISVYGAASRAVVVAEVVKLAPHPTRARLSLVTVDRGGATQTVVCGAPNVPPPGRKVVLAPLGAVLPGAGLTVAPRTIAGVMSEGMLCSEVELGLVAGAGKGAGILVLPAGFGAANGTSLSQALPASCDTIFEIGVTPNRPDALGHIGLAREVAALYALPFQPPPPDAPPRVAAGAGIEALAQVSIEDSERCPHYGVAAVVDVTVAPSPLWLRYRLESLGVRAINNVVDVTNLILMEHGHPIHAFDLDKLSAGRVVVRRARAGEKLTTLDGVERTLVADDLLITDGERPIALAGVMGGQDSEIDDNSKRVLIECAYFDPRGVRRSARRHGLHSEASHRFERGIDPRGVPDVLAQSASLITRLCAGKAVMGTILAGVDPAPLRRIALRLARVKQLLGIEVEATEAAAILTRLGCEVQRSESSPDSMQVLAPSHRPDLLREEDLVEEVMRVYGIDRVPTAPRAVLPLAGRSTVSIADRVRQAAAGLGLSEALTYGFVAPAELARVGAPPACVILKNPLTVERSVMRTSLLPGLLDALARARRHGVNDVRLFSVARTFHTRVSGADLDDGALPYERMDFVAVMCGHRGAGLEQKKPLDVYDAKGLALELLARVLFRKVTLRTGQDVVARYGQLHPRALAELWAEDVLLGQLGALHPDVTDELGLDDACYVVALNVDALKKLAPVTPQYRPIPVLPASSRDLALLVHEDVAAGTVEQTMLNAAGELCEAVELFDVFRGKGVAPDHRSLAFHLRFRDPKAATDPDHARTLTDKEVDRCTQAVVKALRDELGATVRGG